jgi:putative PIN family toxin of toxin-antitoxin system
VSEKPVVVIDTQLLLRATINFASLPAKIIFDLGNLYELAVSAATVAEAQDVLNRPKLRVKFPSLTDSAVARTVALLEAAQKVEPSEVPTVSRDAKDDKFLALATESKAQYLVTEDQDLLVLDPYQGVCIISTLDFYRVLQTLQSTDSQ